MTSVTLSNTVLSQHFYYFLISLSKYLLRKLIQQSNFGKQNEIFFQTAFVKYTYFHPICFTAKSMLFTATLRLRSGVRLRCHASLITTWLNSQSCRLCVYHSCAHLVSSMNWVSCDFPPTCLKNSSRREVVQRWWRSQLLAGWLMSAVCSSRDRALGLSMLQETHVHSCSQMSSYLIAMLKKYNKAEHFYT